jgi:hypothetical protein
MTKSPNFLLLTRRVLRRNWEVFLFVAIGSLLLVSLQLIGDMPAGKGQYPLVRHLVEVLDLLRSKVMPVLHPLSLITAVCYLLLPLSIKLRRFIVDAFAIWFALRIADLFLLINLLVFLRMPDHAQLILQLLIFLPCLLLMWGWVYWRVDIGSQIATGKGIFDFKLADAASPTIYDYFLVSFTSLISSTLNGFSGKTRIARTLIFVHGVMMWDVMGLMLSRAIALVSS